MVSSVDASAFISPDARLVPNYLCALQTISSIDSRRTVLTNAMARKWLSVLMATVPDSSMKA
jgi:hypothetical protein